MTVHRFRLAGVAASLAVAMTAGSGLAVPVTAAAAAVPRETSRVLPAAGPGQTSSVLLITGAQVLAAAGPGGTGAGSVVSPAGRGLAGALLTLGLGGQTYEIPAAAIPYLGRGLALNLFDLGRLRGAERDGRLTVRVSYSGRVPRLPGVQFTSARAGAGQGYLTAASARAFGAALDRQNLADRGSGRFGGDGLFAGGVRLSLATAAPAARGQDRPDYPMSTLTVSGTNLSGEAGQTATW